MATISPFPSLLPTPDDEQPSELVPLDLLQFPDDVPVEEGEPQPTEAPAESDGVLKLTTDQEMRLLQQLRAHYQEATQGRDEVIQRREMRYRRYLGDQTTRQGRQAWDESGQLFLPMTRTSLETLKDELTQALGGIESISASGVGDEDVERADLQTHFLRHALAEINPEHWEELVDAAEHDALQDAIAYFKVYPYAYPYVSESPDQDLLKTIVRIDVVDEGTLLIPPNATKLQWPECSYIGQQLWPSVDEFPSMAARGFTIPDTTTWAMDDAQQYTDDERKLLEFTRQGMQPDDARGEYDPHVEMVEMHELFALDEGKPRVFLTIHWYPHINTLGGGHGNGHIARVMPTALALKQQVYPRPMWPFFPMTTWQQPRQLRGLSLVDRLESAQDLLNRQAEQMVEHGEISILPYIFANVALAGDLPNLRRIRPGEVVPLDNMGSVTFSPQQSQNSHYIQQMQIAKSWGEEDSGITAFVQGRSADQPNAPRTLGQVSLMLQQSQKGFKKQVEHQARQLREVLKFYLGLWQGHVQPTLTIPMPDSTGLQDRLFEGKPINVRRRVPIGPQDLAGPFDIVIGLNPEAHLEQQKLLLAAEKLDAILAPIWPMGRRELWQRVWESLGFQEFDRIWPESVSAIQSMMLMLQGQLTLAGLEAQLTQGGQQPGASGPFAGLFADQGLDLGLEAQASAGGGPGQPPQPGQPLPGPASAGGPGGPLPTPGGGTVAPGQDIAALQALLPQLQAQQGGVPGV